MDGQVVFFLVLPSLYTTYSCCPRAHGSRLRFFLSFFFPSSLLRSSSHKTLATKSSFLEIPPEFKLNRPSLSDAFLSVLVGRSASSIARGKATGSGDFVQHALEGRGFPSPDGHVFRMGWNGAGRGWETLAC